MVNLLQERSLTICTQGNSWMFSRGSSSFKEQYGVRYGTAVRYVFFQARTIDREDAAVSSRSRRRIKRKDNYLVSGTDSLDLGNWACQRWIIRDFEGERATGVARVLRLGMQI